MLNHFNPAQLATCREIHATDIFITDIFELIQHSITQNPLTPAVTLSLVDDIMAKRDTYLSTLRELQQRLGQIGITPMPLEPGTAEIGVLLPRSLFGNEFAELIRELRTLNRILRVLSEIATGTIEPIEVHEISTSDPIFFLGLSVPTLALAGKVVTWALSTWKQVEEIRKIRAETQKIKSFDAQEIKDFFEGKIEKTLKEAVQIEVDELIPASKDVAGRPHELRNDLSWALESVLTRVERGMTVEIRFLPPPAEAARPEEEEAGRAIQAIAPQLTFPEPDPTPILPLPPPEPPSVASN